MLSGCAGIGTIFIKTEWPVKAIAIVGFVSCFLSSIPYLSFTSYVSMVLCCYLYIMASKIENWGIVFKCLQTVVFLDLLIFLMQAIHHDTLMNFGLKDVVHFGTLSQHMQMGSFGVIITAILINFSKFNIFFGFLCAIFCKSSWSFLCVGLGFICMFFQKDTKLIIGILSVLMTIFFIWGIHEHKLSTVSGRLDVWKTSMHWSNKKPLIGWGIGTFKDLFHPFSRFNTQQWREAHNFIIQLFFEIGYPATGCVLVGLGSLIWALYCKSLWIPLSGLIMMLTDALVHFPDRMLQTVPLIVIFLSYCTYSLRKVKKCPSYSQS